MPSAAANHRDPVTPPHLPGGNSCGGLPPGRRFHKRIDVGEPARGAAGESQPKGDTEIMPKAVRYDEFSGIDVLRVEEVERPVPGDGQVLVRVKAAGLNISEAVIRTGAVAELFPSTFPSGQGSDLAGVVEEVGTRVGGFSPRRRRDRVH